MARVCLAFSAHLDGGSFSFFHYVGVPQFVSGFPAGVIALCVAVDVKLLVCPWEESCSGVTYINIFVNLSLLQKVFFLVP